MLVPTFILKQGSPYNFCLCMFANTSRGAIDFDAIGLCVMFCNQESSHECLGQLPAWQLIFDNMFGDQDHSLINAFVEKLIPAF